MKHRFNYLTILLIAILFFSCETKKQNSQVKETEKEAKNENLAAEDFNSQDSDQKAIALADSTMTAMGGRNAWDNTRFIAWDFLGFRKLIWDKWTGNVRVENNNNDFKVLVNINTLEGKVFKNGQELTQPDSLKKYLQRGKDIWINDSYWLVMPFKLKDSGVTLKYIGEDTVMDVQSHVLQLTFENVGVTPENKYLVYIDQNTNLVNQWAFYKNFTDEEAGFILPWQNYKQHGNILLSGDRGPRQLTDIKVFETLPESIFTTFEEVSLDNYNTL